jgi:hypothetical protein
MNRYLLVNGNAESATQSMDKDFWIDWLFAMAVFWSGVAWGLYLNG